LTDNVKTNRKHKLKLISDQSKYHETKENFEQFIEKAVMTNL